MFLETCLNRMQKCRKTQQTAAKCVYLGNIFNPWPYSFHNHIVSLIFPPPFPPSPLVLNLYTLKIIHTNFLISPSSWPRSSHLSRLLFLSAFHVFYDLVTGYSKCEKPSLSRKKADSWPRRSSHLSKFLKNVVNGEDWFTYGTDNVYLWVSGWTGVRHCVCKLISSHHVTVELSPQSSCWWR